MVVCMQGLVFRQVLKTACICRSALALFLQIYGVALAEFSLGSHSISEWQVELIYNLIQPV